MKVLFVCEDNACASIIAEALTWLHWQPPFEVASAGIRPLGYIPDEVKFKWALPQIALDRLRSKGLKEVNVQDFELIISFHSESLEEFLPASFAGKIEDWSGIIEPCYENINNFDKYTQTMYWLLSALLVNPNPTAYPKKDGIYCKVHHVVMSLKEVAMTRHAYFTYSPDYPGLVNEGRKVEPNLFPNTTKIFETHKEEGETSLQLICRKCEKALTLWREQREKQAIEREVGLVERLLAEREGEREDGLRLIGSLWAKQIQMVHRDVLYKKVVMCLAEKMRWTKEEMKILIQAFRSEHERYSQMEKEGLDPLEEIKPFMESFDPESYSSVWGLDSLGMPVEDLIAKVKDLLAKTKDIEDEDLKD